MATARLLVVEDNVANQQLVQALLRRAGFEVVIAASAEEATTILAVERPDAILMDIQLPGKDGLALTRELKEKDSTRDIPVIALTAHAMRGDDAVARAAGCAEYLSKPIDTRTFAGVIGDILARSCAGDQEARERTDE